MPSYIKNTSVGSWCPVLKTETHNGMEWVQRTRAGGRDRRRGMRGIARPVVAAASEVFVVRTTATATATARRATTTASGRVAAGGGACSGVCRAVTMGSTATTPTTPTLRGNADRYGGVIVDDDAEGFPDETRAGAVEEFEETLARSLDAWRAEGVRGVWLKLRTARAAYVPVATTAGFEFHHAEREYVMLTKWLPEDEPSTIPANASHQVGVGAFVYDEEGGKVLLVQEKRGPASGRDLWKMPTGLLEAGEDIPEAAMREVSEETGIETEFGAVIGLRHGHFGAFGKSDMFAVVGLRVKNGASREIKIQEQEIEAAKWATVEEFLANPNIEAGSHAAALHALCAKWSAGEYDGIAGRKLPLGFGRPGEVYTYVRDD